MRRSRVQHACFRPDLLDWAQHAYELLHAAEDALNLTLPYKPKLIRLNTFLKTQHSTPRPSSEIIQIKGRCPRTTAVSPTLRSGFNSLKPIPKRQAFLNPKP